MSLESAVTNAVAEINGIVPPLSQLNAAIASGVTEIGQAYVTRVAQMSRTVYCNPVAGSDVTGDGTALAPYKSLQRCVDTTPYGGRVVALITGPITLIEPVFISGRLLVCQSVDATRHAITIGARAVPAAPTLRETIGFRLRGAAALIFSGLTVVPPPLVSPLDGLAPSIDACFIGDNPADLGPQLVGLFNSSLALPTLSFGPLVSKATSPISLMIHALTLTGTVTSVNGRVVNGVTSTAGTASNSVFGLLTNLATV